LFFFRLFFCFVFKLIIKISQSNAFFVSYLASSFGCEFGFCRGSLSAIGWMLGPV